jgi:hypothetical protein
MTRDQIVQIFVNVVGRQPGVNDQASIDGLTAPGNVMTEKEIANFFAPLASPPNPIDDPVEEETAPEPVPEIIVPPDPPPVETEPETEQEPEQEPKEETEEITLDQLKAMKVKELRPLAKELGIKGKFSKKELIAKIWRKL